MLKFLKTNALFVSMLIGILFHDFLAWMAPATKYLLFAMLLITYSKISPRQLKFEPMHLWLALIQLTGCILVYLLLAPINEELAEGCMICIIAPTATSAPVFASLLGGSIACLATYTIASNLSVAFIAPAIFSFFDMHDVGIDNLTFMQAFWQICKKIVPLLLGPFILAFLIKKLTPNIHEQLKNKQIFSFWLWVVALAVLMAKTTSDLFSMDGNRYAAACTIALGAAVVCALQFLIGRFIGKKYQNKVAGGQGLGQKNTILAIWIAQTFFNPVVAIAPASYVLWQNIINSYQLWYKNRKEHSKK
jgi:BASS family bile acid:Na+ symporter